MNIPHEHIAQADYNEAFFDHLRNVAPLYQDWQAIVLFYVVLHYVDAFLHTLNPPAGIHPRNHAERRRQVDIYLGVGLAADYRELQDRSQDARCEGQRFTDAQVASWYGGEFARIRAHVRAALRLPE